MKTLFVKSPSGEYKIATPRDIAQAAISLVPKKGEKITSPADAVPYIQAKIGSLLVENLLVVFVDNANHILSFEIHSEGMEDQTPVYPRKIMRAALEKHATGIIVAHNHPAGGLIPSAADKDITRKLDQAAKALDLRLLDHVLVGMGQTGYFSFREHGLIQ